MTLFGIGPLELVVILILALIFLGPEELPVVARKMAKLLRDLQALSTELTEQVREELGPEWEELAKAKEDLAEVGKQARRVQTMIGNPTEAIKQEIQQTLSPAGNSSDEEGQQSKAAESAAPEAPRVSTRPLAPPTSTGGGHAEATEEEGQ